MLKPLIISGHPDLSSSNANQTILAEFAKRHPAAEIRRLDSLYPDYKINIEAEQQALVGADIIILQAPFYWYSVPALLKKWLDDVLAFNFAYGSKGDKLKGKHFIVSLTIGGPKESYSASGYNHFEVEALLLPLKQTALLAGMIYLPPVYSHSMVYIPGIYGDLPSITRHALEHVECLSEQVLHIQSENA